MKTDSEDVVKANQEHILSFYDGTEYDETDTPEEAFVHHVKDAMKDGRRKLTPRQAVEKIANGGGYLVYNGDITGYLDRTLGKSKRKQNKNDSFDLYIHLMGRDGAALYEDLVSRPKAPKNDIYTRRQWSRDRQFNARAGQQIAEEIYNEFLNVLPPYDIPASVLMKWGCSTGFLTSEPWDTDAEGRNIYMAFGRKRDGTCWYLGFATRAGDPVWTVKNGSAKRTSEDFPYPPAHPGYIDGSIYGTQKAEVEELMYALQSDSKPVLVSDEFARFKAVGRNGKPILFPEDWAFEQWEIVQNGAADGSWDVRLHTPATPKKGKTVKSASRKGAGVKRKVGTTSDTTKSRKSRKGAGNAKKRRFF